MADLTAGQSKLMIFSAAKDGPVALARPLGRAHRAGQLAAASR
jgi:hypothetical protein